VPRHVLGDRAADAAAGTGYDGHAAIEAEGVHGLKSRREVTLFDR
jgi:hypothetical protein